jgi:hypothetical protein
MEHLARLEDADENVLDCRDMGHSWNHTNDRDIVTDSWGEVIEFTRKDVCNRCRVTRKRVVEVPSFQIKSSTMDYKTADNPYLAPRGEKFTRADARRESYERLISQVKKKRRSRKLAVAS